MKNRFIEQQKHRARQYHRQKSYHFIDGIISRHLYDYMGSGRLTFWDDAVFTINDYRVALWWTHPRLHYSELIEEEARKRVEHLRPEFDLLKNAVPNYQRIGRSRKKIISWTTRRDEKMTQYYKFLAAAVRQVEVEISFEVRPSLSITWCNWAKGMELCLPFEVRSVDDLKALTEIARRLVRRKTTLEAECGGYIYTQADWMKDRAIMENQGQGSIFSHLELAQATSERIGISTA